jgi:hypothetical protein
MTKPLIKLCAPRAPPGWVLRNFLRKTCARLVDDGQQIAVTNMDILAFNSGTRPRTLPARAPA